MGINNFFSEGAILYAENKPIVDQMAMIYDGEIEKFIKELFTAASNKLHEINNKYELKYLPADTSKVIYWDIEDKDDSQGSQRISLFFYPKDNADKIIIEHKIIFTAACIYKVSNKQNKKEIAKVTKTLSNVALKDELKGYCKKRSNGQYSLFDIIVNYSNDTAMQEMAEPFIKVLLALHQEYKSIKEK
jgi:hypothetical protein